MILSRQPAGLFDLGRAELLLDAGHGDYGVRNERVEGTTDNSRQLSFVRYYDGEADDPSDGVPSHLQQYVVLEGSHRAEFAHAEGADPIVIDGWEQLLHLEGPVYYIGLAFFRLALDLDPACDPANYTPGGDDDSFDYWPSGMRLLYALACDLGTLTNDARYIARYTEVVRNVFAREQARGSDARDSLELDVPLTDGVARGLEDRWMLPVPNDETLPLPCERGMLRDGTRIEIDEDGCIGVVDAINPGPPLGYVVSRKVVDYWQRGRLRPRPAHDIDEDDTSERTSPAAPRKAR